MRISEAGAERLDELEPLWRALHAHDASLADQMRAVRPVEESWRRRRSQCVWLAGPDATLLVAEEAGRPIGTRWSAPTRAPSASTDREGLELFYMLLMRTR